MPGFVICAPSEAAPASVAPCADVGAVHHVPVVVDLPMPGVVAFENANQLFAYGFSIVLMFWAIGVTVGAILSLIRKGQ